MFASVADELLAIFREEVNDTVDPHLWSDALAYGYMTEAFDRVLKDTRSSRRRLNLSATAGQDVVRLPRNVTHILSVTMNGSPLPHRNANEVSPRLGRIGRPEAFVRDQFAQGLRLVPAPAADVELVVECDTTIGTPMQAGAPLPTQDAEELRLVLEGMKALAYAKHDADTEDLARASFHQARFEAGLREREQKLRNYRRRPGVVRMEWP